MSDKLLQVEITAREDQGAGIAVFELSNRAAQALPEFTAGSHIDVHLDNGIIRQYSLCNKPDQQNSYRIGVLNDPNSRGGSVAIHDSYVVGKLLNISAPRNLFPLNENAGKTILAGGGIGITPLIAMAYELQKQSKDFELHYCTRSQGAGAFSEELISSFGERVHFHYDDGGDQQLFSPKNTMLPYDPELHVYVCGPTGFMDWVINSATEFGYPSEQVHSEYFSAEVDTSGDSFEVYCADSDITVQVASGQSIVDALKEVGVAVDVSCEQGVCGTCITDVLEGEPDHRDQFLTDDEKQDNDQIAVCCSRAKSARLVLEI